MRKTLSIIIFILATLSGYSQSCETIETNVPVWYGDRQLEPYDESETMQIILDRNDTTFINTSTQGIYICNLLNSTGGGGSTVTIAGQEDLSSSNTISFDWTNEAFNFLNITNEIRLLDRTNCIEGRKFAITIPTGGRIAHNYTASGVNRPFILNGSTDINATEKTSIMFVAYDTDADDVIDVYREIGRATATETDPPPITVEFTVNVTAAEITAAGGTLTLTPSVTFSSGTVSLFDGIGNEFSLTSGIAQNIGYVVADLDGETEKDFTWILETTDATGISALTFDNCNISDYSNLLALTGLTLIDFQYSKLENPIIEVPRLKINNSSDLKTLTVSGIEEYLWANNSASLELCNIINTIISGVNGIKLNSTGLSGMLDLSGVTFANSAPVNLNLNSSLNYIIFKDIIHSINSLNIANNDLISIVFPKSSTEYTILGTTNSNLADVEFQEATIKGIDLRNGSLTGDIDLTKINLNGYIFLTGNSGITQISLSPINTQLTSLQIQSCDITGTLDLSNITVNSSTFWVYNNTNFTGITFKNTTNTISGSSSFYAYNCNFTTLDLSYVDFTADCGFRVENNSSLSSFTWKSGGTFDIKNFNASACALPVAEINEIIVKLDNNGIVSGTVNLSGGTNAAPDGSSGGFDGTTAVSNLAGKGWTVTTN